MHTSKARVRSIETRKRLPAKSTELSHHLSLNRHSTYTLHAPAPPHSPHAAIHTHALAEKSGRDGDVRNRPVSNYRLESRWPITVASSARDRPRGLSRAWSLSSLAESPLRPPHTLSESGVKAAKRASNRDFRAFAGSRISKGRVDNVTYEWEPGRENWFWVWSGSLRTG